MKMIEFRKGSHCVYQCVFHVVFCPKYRKKILNLEFEGKSYVEFLNEFIRPLWVNLLSSEYDVWIEAINILPDHVHLILNCPPHIPVSHIISNLKSKSARYIFKLFPETKKVIGNDFHFWQRGYFVSTIGYDFQQIKSYVSNNK